MTKRLIDKYYANLPQIDLTTEPISIAAIRRLQQQNQHSLRKFAFTWIANGMFLVFVCVLISAVLVFWRESTQALTTTQILKNTHLCSVVLGLACGFAIGTVSAVVEDSHQHIRLLSFVSIFGCFLVYNHYSLEALLLMIISSVFGFLTILSLSIFILRKISSLTQYRLLLTQISELSTTKQQLCQQVLESSSNSPEAKAYLLKIYLQRRKPILLEIYKIGDHLKQLTENKLVDWMSIAVDESH
jgi:hypothetical protein